MWQVGPQEMGVMASRGLAVAGAGTEPAAGLFAVWLGWLGAWLGWLGWLAVWLGWLGAGLASWLRGVTADAQRLLDRGQPVADPVQAAEDLLELGALPGNGDPAHPLGRGTAASGERAGGHWLRVDVRRAARR